MNNRMKELKEIIVKLIIILKNFIHLLSFTLLILLLYKSFVILLNLYNIDNWGFFHHHEKITYNHINIFIFFTCFI